MTLQNNKSLGQHWLKDRSVLAAIADEADLDGTDTVLEVGPGLGTLTSELLRRSGRVVAVEFDEELARKLPGQFPGKPLEVVHEDIIKYDLSALPAGYKVVANVPYYITSKIIEKLMTASNKPSVVVILVQKEVAERVAAETGDMSILAVGTQIFAETRLGIAVPREYFTPPPKVDSQVVVLTTRPKPLVTKENERLFFRVVKAGFGAKRKMLRSSISAGLSLDKPETEDLLKSVSIDSSKRAEDLSIDDWLGLTAAYEARR